jgi:hypothetical protein
VFQAIVRSGYASEANSFDPSVAVQEVLVILSGPEGLTTDKIVATFHDLVPAEEVSSILDHLENGGWTERREDGRAVASSRAREQGCKLYSNIPGSKSIAVVEQETGIAIGNISLSIDNIFILGGQAWVVRKRSAERVLMSKVESRTEIAYLTSYDRFGSFFDLLPLDMRMRYKKALVKEQELHSRDLRESAMVAARWASIYPLSLFGRSLPRSGVLRQIRRGEAASPAVSRTGLRIIAAFAVQYIAIVHGDLSLSGDANAQ